MPRRLTFLEFFAGGGLVRRGLEPGWRCLFANDVSPMKCASYRDNYGDAELVEGSIGGLATNDLPSETADLAWASFPCQDLSLAGARAGLSGARSGLFGEFVRLMSALRSERRAPRALAIENVTGLLTSNGGRDFALVASEIARLGYAVAPMVLDAADYAPQSRKRLFILGLPPAASSGAPGEAHPMTLRTAVSALPKSTAGTVNWLSPAPPPARNADLAAILDADDGADWFGEDETSRLLRFASPATAARIDAARAGGERTVGAAFRRMRTEGGRKVQRLEARFDGLAGCLRTPAGGSSRQLVLVIDQGAAKLRLMTPREGARLMGLPDEHVLPARPNHALHILGDGVCAPLAARLAETVIAPALADGAAAA